MVDVFSKEKRSWIMGRVSARDTAPELKVRSVAHRLGFRFRLHRKDLPGKPDIVFPRLQKVIFVNGCFWHGHRCARGKRIPKVNRQYWTEKIRGNMARDKKSRRLLKESGWDVLVVWECETKDIDALEAKVYQFLSCNGG